MEYKILIYIIGIIIYFIYSAGKATKKRNELRQQRKSTSGQKSWEDELKDILSRTTGVSQFVRQEEEKVSTASSSHYREEDEDEEWNVRGMDEKMPETKEYEELHHREWDAHLAQEKYSVEIDETSLQEHVKELEEQMERREPENSVGHQMIKKEKFDARKAFIYSEIFRAKYIED
ncbi:MAG: hypothetical protein GC180_01000 [Bacteroidetes bacterium]|nr:hypothetical protein [Bacteroidota bacterium]